MGRGFKKINRGHLKNGDFSSAYAISRIRFVIPSITLPPIPCLMAERF
jgi:hypothetical protein